MVPRTTNRKLPPQKSSSSTAPAASPKMEITPPINVTMLMVEIAFGRENFKSSSQKLMSGWMIETALVRPAKKSIPNHNVCIMFPRGSWPKT